MRKRFAGKITMETTRQAYIMKMSERKKKEESLGRIQ